MRSGFTLIELLIVVAIISILAAIAVPNFLEAQTRSKVSRVQSDMRTLSVAVEAYCVDHNQYPYRHYGSNNPEENSDHFVPDLATRLENLSRLTTPIAYISSLPKDVFEKNVPPPLNIIDYYDSVQTYRAINFLRPPNATRKSTSAYMLVSVGPDGYLGLLSSGAPGGYPPQPREYRYTFFDVYDPTNGTISAGNLYRLQNNAEITTLRP